MNMQFLHEVWIEACDTGVVALGFFIIGPTLLGMLYSLVVDHRDKGRN